MNGSQTFFRKATLVATFSIITVLVGGLFVSVPMAHATTAGNIVLSAPASNVYWRGTQTINWSIVNIASLSKVSVLYSYGTGTFTNLVTNQDVSSQGTYTWDTTNPQLSDGTYHIYVRDNTGEVSSTTTFYLDNTPPVTTLTTNKNPDSTTGWYNSTTNTPTITLTCTDSLSGCSSINYAWYNAVTHDVVVASTTVTTTSSGTLGSLTGTITSPQGDNILVYYSEDNAVDNETPAKHNIETAQTAEFKVDTHAPTISSYTLDNGTSDVYFNPNNSNTNLASTTIKLTASEPVEFSRIYICPTSVTTCNGSSHNYTKEFTGSSNLATSTTIVWNGDKSPTGSGTANNGAYKLGVSIIDVAGNKTKADLSTLTTHPTITVDTVAPTMTLTSPVADTVYEGASDSATTTSASAISFKSSDTNPLTYTYSVDGLATTSPVSVSNDGTTVNKFSMSGLHDGRNTIVVTVTDGAGNSISSGPISIVFDNNKTLTVSNNALDHADFSAIQNAITAASSGDTIEIYPGTGTYTTNVTVGKELTIENAPTATATSTIDGRMTIGHDNVTIHGLKFTNPTGDNALVISGVNGVSVTDNMFNTIGGTGNVRGIDIEGGASSATITENQFRNITSSAGVNGIYIGGTTTKSTGINISHNVFDTITTTSTSQYGIAYGILAINSAGTELTATDNTFSNISGFGTHAIGLEGPTPNTSITGNTFTGLSATPSAAAINTYPSVAYDKFGIFFQNNPDGGSVTISSNKFDGKKIDFGGVAVFPGASYTVNAQNNWWGSGTGPYSPNLNPNGLGVYVSPNVDFTPYYVNESKTILSNKSVNDVYVNKTYTDGSASPHIFGYNAFAKIQNGVDAPALATTTPFGTVHVAAGTYDEQIVINKSLTLEGTGDTTILKPSQTTASTFQLFARGTNSDGKDTSPIIGVDTTGGTVNINGFKIDGASVASVPSGSSELVGIFYRDTNGVISNMNISNLNIKNGGGMYLVGHDTLVSLEVKDNVVSDYLKNGITANYPDMTANIHGNTVTGGGPTDSIAQNGIQIGFGATGEIKSNTVKDNVWTGIYESSVDNNPTTDTTADGAAGILLYHTSGTVEVSGNTLTDNQFGVWTVGATAVNIHNNTITGLTHTGNAYPTGIAVWSADQWFNYFDYDEVGTTGSINNNTINSNDYGILVRDYTTGNAVEPSVTASKNNIADNVIAGAWSNSSFNAEKNWWGDKTGPENDALNPSGIGSSASDNIDFSPFCTNVECTEFASIDPIASFGLNFNPNTQIISAPASPVYSTLTVTAKDAGGYTVVNDTTTPVSLSVVSGPGATLTNSNLIMGADGTTGTTITSNSVGTTTVRAVDQNNTSAFGTKTIKFTKDDVTPPTIVSTTPANGAPGVAITASPTITFSEPIDYLTVSPANIQLHKYSNDSVVPALVSLANGGTTVIIKPDSSLENGTEYYYTVSTSVTDLAGNALVNAWNKGNEASHEFTTATIQPIVINSVTAVRTVATADGKYNDGWHYIYKITVNTPAAAKNLSVLFADWTQNGGGTGTVSANGNMRLLFNSKTGGGLGSSVGAISDTDIENGFGNVKSYAIGNAYTDQKLGGSTTPIDISGLDNSTRPGQQIQFDVYTKLPIGTPTGFYNTTYGIQVN